jgi:GntR family carbon starvation induced transcriptional regulator
MRARKVEDVTDIPTVEEDLGLPVYDRLRSDIISGVYAPGSALRFAEMQTRYGLGVSRLREALAQLAADRLVVREINRGFRVPEISVESFDDIAKMRRLLEPGAFRVSIENGDEAWEERVIVTAHRLDRAFRRYETETLSDVQDVWERCHRAFHEALIGACGSPVTMHFCGVLYDHFDRYRRLIGFDEPAQQRLAKQHRALADCAVDRNVDEAEAMLTAHVEQTVKVVRGALETRLGATASARKDH